MRDMILWAPSAFGRWVKRLFTRESLADAAKTAVWVVPLTVLIWIYAEQQQRTDEKDMTVVVNVRSTDPDRVVTVHRGDDLPMITMSGPRASVELVKNELNKPGENHLITIDVPNDQPPGLTTVDLAPQIARAPIFIKNGIDVSNVHPARIQVQVDALETRELEVQPSPNANLDGPASFDPKMVKVKAPHAVFVDADARAGGKPLVAYAQIPATGDRAKPGIHPDISLPLEVPLQGDNVTLLNGSQVTATYNIKASFITDEVPALLIETLYVGQMANETIVEAPPVVKVNIIGPRDQVDRVKARSNNNEAPLPYAILKIEPSDVPAAAGITKPVTKILDFNLTEPDVRVDDKAKYPIDVKIRRRAPQ